MTYGGDSDNQIRDAILSKGTSEYLRRKLLEDGRGLMLAVTLEIAARCESIEEQMASMSGAQNLCTELIPNGNMETGMLKVKRKTTTLMTESAIDVEVLSTGGEIPNALHEEQHATRVRGKTTMQKCAAPKAGR